MNSQKDWTEYSWFAEEDGKSLPFTRDVNHFSFSKKYIQRNWFAEKTKQNRFIKLNLNANLFLLVRADRKDTCRYVQPVTIPIPQFHIHFNSVL